MRYELFYLIGASKEGEVDKIKTDVKEIVVLAGGVFEEKETQDKRRLSYEVKHETHGIYVAQRFSLEEPTKIQDVTNKLNLYTGVLRFVISRADELPELKTKEEKMAEANKPARERAQEKREEKPAKEVKEIKEEKKEEKVEEPKEETKEEPKEEEKKEKTTDEDIDKKLEEILNI